MPSKRRIPLSPGFHAEPGETKGHQHDVYTTLGELHGWKRIHVGTLMKEAVLAWAETAKAAMPRGQATPEGLHAYEPHEKHPHCAICGYARSERLMHTPDPAYMRPLSDTRIRILKLTPGQREALAVLARAEEPMNTNEISSRAGHRYSPWAYGKLRALKARELVVYCPPPPAGVGTWEVTDAGRSALAEAEKADG